MHQAGATYIEDLGYIGFVPNGDLLEALQGPDVPKPDVAWIVDGNEEGALLDDLDGCDHGHVADESAFQLVIAEAFVQLVGIDSILIAAGEQELEAEGGV